MSAPWSTESRVSQTPGPHPGSRADQVSLAALAAGAAGVALLPASRAWTWELAALVLAAVVALGAGVQDLRTRRVPNGLTLPLILLGLGVSAVRVGLGDLPWSALGFVAVAWVAGLVVWGVRLLGGGDVKLMMGLLALAPTLDHVLALSLALGLGLAVYLTLDRRSGRWQGVAALIMTVSLGRVLPARAEVAEAYRTRANPAAPWIAIGYIGYLLGAGVRW